MADIRTVIQHIRSGNMAAARRNLVPVLKASPNDERAWYLMHLVVDDPQQKQDCLRRVLQLNPGNTDAQQKLAELEAASTAPPQVTASTTAAAPAPEQPDDAIAWEASDDGEFAWDSPADDDADAAPPPPIAPDDDEGDSAFAIDDGAPLMPPEGASRPELPQTSPPFVMGEDDDASFSWGGTLERAQERGMGQPLPADDSPGVDDDWSPPPTGTLFPWEGDEKPKEDPNVIPDPTPAVTPTDASGTGELHFPWESPEVAADDAPGAAPDASAPWETVGVDEVGAEAWADDAGDDSPPDVFDEAATPTSAADDPFAEAAAPTPAADDPFAEAVDAAPAEDDDTFPWALGDDDDDEDAFPWESDGGGFQGFTSDDATPLPATGDTPGESSPDWTIAGNGEGGSDDLPEPFEWEPEELAGPDPLASLRTAAADDAPDDTPDWAIGPATDAPLFPPADDSDDDLSFLFGNSDDDDMPAWMSSADEPDALGKAASLFPQDEPAAWDGGEAIQGDSDWDALRAKEDETPEEEATVDWASSGDDLPTWGESSLGTSRDLFGGDLGDLDLGAADDPTLVPVADDDDGDDEEKPRGLARFLPFMRRKKKQPADTPPDDATDVDEDEPAHVDPYVDLSDDYDVDAVFDEDGDDVEPAAVHSRLAALGGSRDGDDDDDDGTPAPLPEELEARAKERAETLKRQQRRQRLGRLLRNIMLVLLLAVLLLACGAGFFVVNTGIYTLPEPLNGYAAAVGLVPAPTVDPNAPTAAPSATPPPSETPLPTPTDEPFPTLQPTFTPTTPSENDQTATPDAPLDLPVGLDPANLPGAQMAFISNGELLLLPLGETLGAEPSVGDNFIPALNGVDLNVAGVDYSAVANAWAIAGVDNLGAPAVTGLFVITTGPEGTFSTLVSDGDIDISSPAWSPDGTRIVYVAEQNGFRHVWVVDISGETPVARQLSDGLYDDEDPTWSPDGSQIAFSSDRNGSFDLFVMQADTGDTIDLPAAALTFDAENDERQPAWSPNGELIAYVSNSQGAPNIFLLEPGSPATAPFAVTFGRASNEFPTWSPDGSLLAFTSTQDGNFELYVASLDGDQQLRLTRTGLESEVRPVWLSGIVDTSSPPAPDAGDDPDAEASPTPQG